MSFRQRKSQIHNSSQMAIRNNENQDKFETDGKISDITLVAQKSVQLSLEIEAGTIVKLNKIPNNEITVGL